MEQTSNARIGADTAGMLLTLQAMAYSALWGASKVDGWLVLLGYALAICCFALLVLIFVLDMKQ